MVRKEDVAAIKTGASRRELEDADPRRLVAQQHLLQRRLRPLQRVANVSHRNANQRPLLFSLLQVRLSPRNFWYCTNVSNTHCVDFWEWSKRYLDAVKYSQN